MNFLKKYTKYMILFVFCVAVIAVYKTFDNITSIFHSIGVFFGAFKPFFIGFIIAYMLNLPSVKLSELLVRTNSKFIRKHSYGISILAVYILALILVAVTLGVLLPAIYGNIVDLTSHLPSYMTSIMNWINDLDIMKKAGISIDNLDAAGTIMSLINKFDAIQFGKYIDGVFSMTSGLLNAFIAIISSVYMLLDKKTILNGVKRIINVLFKRETADSITWHTGRINDIFTKFIYCRLICSVISGIVSGIVLTLLGVKYAVILAIITVALDMIPYFGSIISFFISIIVAWVTGGVWQMIWAAVALLIIQQLDGNILSPKIMGDSLELRPLWVIVAVSVGGTLFGFIGMLVSVPVVAVIRTVVNDYLEEFAEKKKQRNIIEGGDLEE